MVRDGSDPHCAQVSEGFQVSEGDGQNDMNDDQRANHGARSLRVNPAAAAPTGPLVLLVMDGVGRGAGDEFDAVAQARTPAMDQLRERGLYRTIYAHGPYVGLPSRTDMGNSEVGHNALGAGRIFDQGAKRINSALESGAIWRGVWRDIVERLTARQSSLHLIGLLSDGNVHSHLDHLFAIIDRAAQERIPRVYIHGLLDGRDVPEGSAERYVRAVLEHLEKVTAGTDLDYRIASGGGRMITTMDRYEADWRIVERGWRAHVLGTERPFPSALEAIRVLREESPGISDQLLPAFTVVRDGEPVGRVRDGDAIVLFNFRGDRSIELARAFTEAEFKGFDRGPLPDVLFAGLTLYDGDTNLPERRLVEPEAVPGTISEYLARTGVTQWAGAETQKYGHVTYFWNGNRSDKFDERTETYVEIPSDRVRFDQRPWMKSAETADEVIAAIRSGEYQFIRANFAGGDMVGHTGSFIPTVIAVEAVDLAIGRIREEVERAGGCLVVTADHGNAEDMVQRDKQGRPVLDDDGDPTWKTSHSVNPIPFFIVDYGGRQLALRPDLPEAGLANVAATLVELLGYLPPAEYEPGLVSWEGRAA